MVMSERGMADMAEMEMPLPDNTLPMMSGQGPYGPVEMGGMFTVLKVRSDQPRGSYKDPGWYKAPPGSVAYEWTGQLAAPARPPEAASSLKAGKSIEMTVRKPSGHSGH
jgi:hypothetical protein